MTDPRSRAGLGQEPFRMPTRRAMGWAHVSALVCPNGHAMRTDAFAFTDAAIRCKTRTPGGECGKLLFIVAAIPARLPQTRPEYVFFVEVTYPEVRHIQERHLGTLDILRWLGATHQPAPPAADEQGSAA